jgi:hypothetical protein
MGDYRKVFFLILTERGSIPAEIKTPPKSGVFLHYGVIAD